MEHDGLQYNSSVDNGASTSGAGANAPALLVPNHSSSGPNNQSGTGRILCPVAGCPEASPLSTKHFRGFASIKNHLNAHCTGNLTGAIPAEFLR